uniref:Peptidase S1 domain-containing protein n=1 Tax=Pseudonaja textilis TaxID=8673 RepID=A0A670ZKI9_PSETE
FNGAFIRALKNWQEITACNVSDVSPFGEKKMFLLQGDSGGSLVCQREHGPWTLIGVTSWGIGCARRTPGVFTDLTKVLPWIQQHIDTGSNKISPIL